MVFSFFDTVFIAIWFNRVFSRGHICTHFLVFYKWEDKLRQAGLFFVFFRQELRLSDSIWGNFHQSIRHLGKLSKVCSAYVPSKAIIVVTIQHTHLIAWGDIFNLLTLFQNRNPLQMKHWGLLCLVVFTSLVQSFNRLFSLLKTFFFALYTKKKYPELIFAIFFL